MKTQMVMNKLDIYIKTEWKFSSEPERIECKDWLNKFWERTDKENDSRGLFYYPF